MPEISRFYGIVIIMWPNDHLPPHFHARCGRQTILVRISDGEAIGNFPTAKLKLVREWWNLHRDELLLNWRLRAQCLPPRYIEPLD